MTLVPVSRLVAECSFPGVLLQLPLSLRSAGAAGSGKSLDNGQETHQWLHILEYVRVMLGNKDGPLFSSGGGRGVGKFPKKINPAQQKLLGEKSCKGTHREKIKQLLSTRQVIFDVEKILA